MTFCKFCGTLLIHTNRCEKCGTINKPQVKPFAVPSQQAQDELKPESQIAEPKRKRGRPPKPKPEIKVEKPKIECPYCQGASIKQGKRTTQNGKVQCYTCKSCGKKFCENSAEGIKAKKYQYLAYSMHLKGLSYRDISKKLEGHFNYKVWASTIQRWIMNINGNKQPRIKKINAPEIIKNESNFDEALIEYYRKTLNVFHKINGILNEQTPDAYRFKEIECEIEALADETEIDDDAYALLTYITDNYKEIGSETAKKIISEWVGFRTDLLTDGINRYT